MRIHASDYGRICLRTDKTESVKLASSLQTMTNLSTAPILHGQQYEPVALKAFASQTGKKIRQCGIVVHPRKLFLGCSPDCLVGTDSLIEVKCPYSAHDKRISPATVPYLYEKNGELFLQENHRYFFQVMGTLACTGRRAILQYGI